MNKTVWRRYSVVMSNNLGTFRVDMPVQARDVAEAKRIARDRIGERTPALGTVRVVSVHERGQ